MQPVIRTARHSDTNDKMRIRFYHCGQLSEKIQEQIKQIIWDTWRQLVTVVRWPRNNVIELKLSPKMIHSAGFLEVEQVLTALWEKVLAAVRRLTELEAVTTKKAAS